jgi:uncharacterized coiled-coil protein SlyX
MAGNVLKQFAVVAGAGLAIGLKSGTSSKREAMSISPEDILNLEPILDRFDQIEARLSTIEAAQIVARDKPVADTAPVERQLAEIRQQVPAMLEAMIAPYIAEMRERLLLETRETVEAALDAFQTAMEKGVSARMTTIEKTLIDQSGIIATLSERAIESETNLQRLISAVEKLCERTDARSVASTPAASREPSFAELPFESHLKQAIQRQPDAGAVRSDGFRPRIVKEEEGTPRHRRPMSRI